jgi:hypothetical protein
MFPKDWGPIYWYFIHQVVWFQKRCGYRALEKRKKKERLRKTKDFFMILPYLLPCSTCGLKTKKYCDMYPLDKLNNIEKIAKWTVNFHNYTNELLGKQTYTYEKVNNKLSNEMPDHILLFRMVDIVSKESSKREACSPHQIFYKSFFYLLPFIFPCLVCSDHFSLFLPYKYTLASEIWMNIGIPMIKSHDLVHVTILFGEKDIRWNQDKSNKNGFAMNKDIESIFFLKGWVFRDLGEISFQIVKNGLEITNEKSGHCFVYRIFPVEKNRYYKILIRCSNINKKKRDENNATTTTTTSNYFVLTSLENENIMMEQSFFCNLSKVYIPHNGCTQVSFLSPEKNSFFIFKICFSGNSRKKDKILIENIKVKPFVVE